MSQQFKVGDVCVIVESANAMPSEQRYLGMTVTLTGDCGDGFFVTDIKHHNGRPLEVKYTALRLKRPPEEPKSDFTPCEDDFTEWFNNVRSAEKCR